MSDIKTLQEAIVQFCEERNWKQFHNPKDLALSLTLESAEVLEHFQWKSPEEIERHIKENKEDIAGELSDTFYWILLMAYYLDIDLVKTFEAKMSENAKKYPIEKSRGKHTKYSKL